MKSTLRSIGIAALVCITITGCSPGEEGIAPERTPVAGEELVRPEGDVCEGKEVLRMDDSELVYIQAVDGVASSFDQTPDWAPAPDPTAPINGDMTTRWSSDYVEEAPWIYFDMGQERTINNIIIHWERAFAVDYRIFVSDDAETWEEVYHKADNPGGMNEIFFEPVECRYVKVRGYEKTNEDWGISIWEFEIYGPADQNPDAEFTKETYLAQTTDEEDRARVEKRINELAAPVVPLEENPFRKGVVFTSWMSDEFLTVASDLTLITLKEMGFDTVSIMVPAYQEELHSTEIYVNDGPGGDTPSVEAIEHAIKTAHRLGMRVHLKPHVDPRTDEPRVNIMPSDAWFDSYEEFILKYAEIAERNNVETFSVGTELEATTFDAWNHRWLDIIAKTREVFSGKLTYAANWTEYQDVLFWRELDSIGIDAYFPLTRKEDPTLEDIMEGWEGIADEIEAWLEEEGLTEMGVVLTEIGYPSASGAAMQPWVAISDTPNEQEQADCFEAMFHVLLQRDWFKGYYIWQYFPQKRWSPLGFTVRDKLAEDVIRKYLAK